MAICLEPSWRAAGGFVATTLWDAGNLVKGGIGPHSHSQKQKEGDHRLGPQRMGTNAKTKGLFQVGFGLSYGCFPNFPAPWGPSAFSSSKDSGRRDGAHGSEHYTSATPFSSRLLPRSPSCDRLFSVTAFGVKFMDKSSNWPSRSYQ